MKNKRWIREQAIPVVLTVVVFVVLCILLYGVILILNVFSRTDIYTQIRWSDVLVGLTIYLKTSVDFAILIGNLMSKFTGWKNRIAIEIGTGLGNALGTLIILTIWNFFRDVEWLLVLMIFIAALVLLKLAEEGLEHAVEGERGFPRWFKTVIHYFKQSLKLVNNAVMPVLKYVIPNLSMRPKANLTLWGLFSASFTIPFILGLDDFAGYVPLFSIVNVFGFAIGVFLGHMILNMALFVSPAKTIKLVKNPVISFVGSIVFVGLAIWGFVEVYRILFLHN